jgi:uncharacterized membrane protein YphA (DoxX/SURF4 family)
MENLEYLQDYFADPYVVAFARTLISLILIAGGISKLADISGFAELLKKYNLLPSFLTSLTAILLPVIEIITGVFLLTNLLISWASLSALLLFVIFTLAMTINIIRGNRQIPCGCFGTASNVPLSWWHVGRNILFVFLSVVSLSIGEEYIGKNLSLEENLTVMIVTATLLLSIWLLGLIQRLWRQSPL